MKLPWQKAKDAEGNETLNIELPKEMSEKIDAAISSGQESKSRFDELKTSLDNINARFLREDEERQRQQNAARQQQQQQEAQATDDEITQLMLTDPVAATRRIVKQSTDNQGVALLTMRADALRRDVFEDTERFPYYTGEIRSEIDKLLEGQTLQHRNDRGVIENAYYATLGRHQREMADGKLKSRFATSEGNRGTATGNIKGTEEPVVKPLDEDGRKAARILGFKDDDYAKMLHEEGVGYV
jgi:Arc/MetJ-type ribon-helix-helix transcriptional regulator